MEILDLISRVHFAPFASRLPRYLKFTRCKKHRNLNISVTVDRAYIAVTVDRAYIAVTVDRAYIAVTVDRAYI